MHLFKPENSLFTYNKATKISLYWVNPKGDFIASTTNEPISKTATDIYLYAPYPLNLLAFDYINLHSDISLHRMRLMLLASYLRIERYLYGSDTTSSLMRIIIAKRFDKQITPLYFITINKWIYVIDKWLQKLKTKTPL